MSIATQTRTLAIIALACTLIVGCSKGDVWEEQALGAVAEFHDIYFTDSTTGWMVGGSWVTDGGIIGRTRDAGKTWTFTSGVVADRYGGGDAFYQLSAVHFRDDQMGWVVGAGGNIFRTIDGGQQWRIVRRGRVPYDHMSDIQFVDDLCGWAVSTTGILRTEDGGETWRYSLRATNRNGNYFPVAVQFLDTLNGWAVGRFGEVLRSADGGMTWTRVSVPVGTAVDFTSLSFVDATTGWVVGRDGLILHTRDGAETWVQQTSEFTDDLLAVQFVDTLAGWTIGSTSDNSSVVLRTRNGGVSWLVEHEVVGLRLSALFVADSTRAWAAGRHLAEGEHRMLRMTGQGN